jgi:hypothetical protein
MLEPVFKENEPLVAQHGNPTLQQVFNALIVLAAHEPEDMEQCAPVIADEFQKRFGLSPKECLEIAQTCKAVLNSDI